MCFGGWDLYDVDLPRMFRQVKFGYAHYLRMFPRWGLNDLHSVYQVHVSSGRVCMIYVLSTTRIHLPKSI